MNKEVTFIRVNGRVIPIKNKGFTKQDAKNTGLVATGTGISVGSGLYASKLLKQSFGAYNLSAHIRGISKIHKARKLPTYSNLIKDAAKLKVAAKGLSKRAFAVASIGTTIGSIIGGTGALNLAKDRTDKETALAVGSGFGAVASGVGIAVLSRKTKVGHILNAFRFTSPNKRLGDFFSLWSKTGSKRTNALVSKYEEIARRASKEKSIVKLNKARKKKIDPNQTSFL